VIHLLGGACPHRLAHFGRRLDVLFADARLTGFGGMVTQAWVAVSRHRRTHGDHGGNLVVESHSFFHLLYTLRRGRRQKGYTGIKKTPTGAGQRLRGGSGLMLLFTGSLGSQANWLQSVR